MAQIRVIKKRMQAVSTITRITKTMQMIATAKFTAAAQRAKATKPYTEKVRKLVAEVAAASDEIESPLISGPSEPVRRELLLVISSDRGLCGAFNATVIRSALQQTRSCRDNKVEVDIEVAGKKAVGVFKFQKIPIVNQYVFGDKPSYEEIERLASRYIDDFVEGKYDAIRVAYMRFQSTSRQIPEVLQLLPLAAPTAETTEPSEVPVPSTATNYEFSPSSEALLDDLLPLTVKTTLFQAFNDAVVSEQIMRMVAMKAATENASEFGRTLRMKFNRARQSQITTELTEIISGAAALE